MIFSKKPLYSLSRGLQAYLKKYNRFCEELLSYDDLLKKVEINKFKKVEINWLKVDYKKGAKEELEDLIKKIYASLKSGRYKVDSKYLSVITLEYKYSGNSNPFRVKIKNVLNDEYNYFYIKKFDASRVYGLELEYLLSPDEVSFIVYKNTLVEEHILGIPGNVFIKEKLSLCSEKEKLQLAKEFVKFNERSLVRLLGDMKSTNYVVVPMHDFDHKLYKIRAIGFNQQSHAGNYKKYLPQFFKDNESMVNLVKNTLIKNTIVKCKKEERLLVAKRILRKQTRIENLLRCMRQDSISSPTKIARLSLYFYRLTSDVSFKRTGNMGDILTHIFAYISKYELKKELSIS